MFRTHQLRRLHTLLDPFAEDPISKLIAFVGEGDEDDADQDESEDEESSDDADDGEEDSGKQTSKKKPSSKLRRKAAEDDDEDGESDDKDDDRKSPAYVKARLERQKRTIARKAGFDSIEEMEQAAKAHRENTEKNQTETQRLQKVEKRLMKRVDEVVAENQDLKLDLAVTRVLATEYPDLAGHEDWIKPRLLQEIEDDEWDDDRKLGKVVKDVVKAYAEAHEVEASGGTAGKSKRNGSALGTGRTPQRTRGGAPNAVREGAERHGQEMASVARRNFRW